MRVLMRQMLEMAIARTVLDAEENGYRVFGDVSRESYELAALAFLGRREPFTFAFTSIATNKMVVLDVQARRVMIAFGSVKDPTLRELSSHSLLNGKFWYELTEAVGAP